jgi:hypothetical protein
MVVVDFLEFNHAALKNIVGETIHGREFDFKVSAEETWATSTDGYITLPDPFVLESGSKTAWCSHTRKFDGAFTLYLEWTKEEVKDEGQNTNT